jgi:hypothetical protein
MKYAGYLNRKALITRKRISKKTKIALLFYFPSLGRHPKPKVTALLNLPGTLREIKSCSIE